LPTATTQGRGPVDPAAGEKDDVRHAGADAVRHVREDGEVAGGRDGREGPGRSRGRRGGGCPETAG
jgi:hypothetical protein